jgi:hypothetical protein
MAAGTAGGRAVDVRTEEGWPASTDPTADSIEPPAMGGAKPNAYSEGDKPPPADDDTDKIARLDARGAR